MTQYFGSYEKGSIYRKWGQVQIFVQKQLSEPIQTVKIQAIDIWRLIGFIVNMNRFKWTQDEEWCDSDFYEFIQCRSERNHDTTQPDMNRITNDTIQNIVNRFIWSQKLLWYDSHINESIQWHITWNMTKTSTMQDTKESRTLRHWCWVL